MASWLQKIGFKSKESAIEAVKEVTAEEVVTSTATDTQPATRVHATVGPTRWGGAYESDGQKFRGGIIHSGSSPIINHTRTRANARNAFHNSVPAQAIVKRFVEIVVGDGIRIEPKPAVELLGITQQRGEEWSRDFRDRFDMWASSKQASLREDQNLYQMQALAETESQRDGEYFKRFHYLKDRGRISTLAIDNIEQSQIIGDALTNTNSFASWLNDGIMRDARGREVGYNIRARRSNGQVESIKVPAMSGGRRMMIHGFTPEYAGQSRGYSSFHNSLQELSQYTNFSVAHIQKAIHQASIVLSKETAAGSVATGTSFSVGDVAGVPNLTVSTDSGDVTPAAEATAPSLTPIDAAISPGGIAVFNNGPGEKLTPFNNTSPSDNYAPFTTMFLSLLCASKSMPFEVFLQKFDSNYTAARAALIQVYRYARMLKGEHVSDFLSEVQESWASEEIAAGRIVAPGWQDPILRRAWLRADWNGPQMPDIDPAKTMKSAKDAIEAHISNVPLEANKINGTDPAMNRAINERILGGAKPAHWNSQSQEPVTATNSTGVK